MDEETLKRNTDCVFFLASPLTCKKGLECEYRHSEIARLNPRDCWYWLAGNCLNPACGFRHPPLDLHVEATHESTVAPCQSFATAKKNNMPCYFYYSGFCSKGIGCSFSHGPDWFTPSAKYLKDSSLVTRRPVPKDDDIARKAIGSSPSSGKLNLSRTFPEAANQSEPASVNMLKLSKLSEISVAEIEVAPAEGSLFPAGPALQRSCISTNQSLEEPVVIERWKASPHFHVFADGNNSETLYYKDNQEEYSLPYVQNEDELNSPSSGYEFEEPPEYDPTNPHAEIFCEYGVDDTWKNSGSSCSPGNAGIVQDELLSGERDLLHMELEVGDCPNVDLRDCLRRCRGNGDRSASWLLRTCNSSRSNAYRRIRLGRNQCSQRLHKRLTAFVKKSTAGSPQYCRFSLNGLRKHDSLRHSRVQSFRKHQRKGQLHATRASRYPFSRGRRSYRESADFAGPKTLDQIKEEGMRAEFDREGSARCSTVDFPGPKPLNELLKNKTM